MSQAVLPVPVVSAPPPPSTVIATAGPAGWDRVVGFARTLWIDWRLATVKRYLLPIPRLATLPDVGNTEDRTFSLGRVLSLPQAYGVEMCVRTAPDGRPVVIPLRPQPRALSTGRSSSPR